MSEELFDVQPEKVTLMLKGKEREIRFSFSSWAKIEKEFGSLKNVDKLFDDLDEMPYNTIMKLLWFGIADKEGLDEETYLDEYDVKSVPMIQKKFFKAFFGSLPMDKGGDSKQAVEAK